MNSFRLSVILVILSLSSIAQSQSHDEYIIEVIVFEQLEIIDNEQLEPKDLNLKDINAVTLLDSPEIILNENGKIIITEGELNSEKISGFGEIILNNSAYLNLTDIYPIFEGISVHINSNESWIRFYNLDPSSAYYYYHDNIFYEDQQLSYPEEIRFDNYYHDGCVIRPESDNFSNLVIYDENNLNGEFTSILNNTVFAGESIPNYLNTVSYTHLTLPTKA